MKKSIFCTAIIALVLGLSLSLSGCEKQVSITMTKSDSNGQSESSYTSSSETRTQSESNHKEMTTIIDENSNFKGSVVATGTGSVVVNGNLAYIDGREIEFDSKKGVSISYDGDKVLLNGKPVKYKDSSSDKKPINAEIQLTGTLVKIPVHKINAIHSSLPITQNCSDDNTSYLMVDSALAPYLSDRVPNAFIHLKNGHYKIHGQLEVQLFTPKFEYL